MRRNSIFLAVALCAAVCRAESPAPYPITVNSRAAVAPPIKVYRGNAHSFRASFVDGSTASSITGTPFMAWATSTVATVNSTSTYSIVSAVSGIVDFAFSPTALNFAAGRYIYEVGVRGTNGNPSVYRQGVFEIVGSPIGTGVGPVEWTSNIVWGAYSYSQTATEGPVRPDWSTITAVTNADGSITLSASASSMTNGLASVAYVDAATNGARAFTNGLASIAYADATYATLAQGIAATNAQARVGVVETNAVTFGDARYLATITNGQLATLQGVKAATSAGAALISSGNSTCMTWGAGGGCNVTFQDGTTVNGALTANGGGNVLTNNGVTLAAGTSIGLSSTALTNGAAITISYTGTAVSTNGLASTNFVAEYVAAAVTNGMGGGTVNPAWTTNTVTLTSNQIAYAVSTLPGNLGRRARVSLTTTNIGLPMSAKVTWYDGPNSNAQDKIADSGVITLSTATSPSNSIAGTNLLYVSGLNAPNGGLVKIESPNGVEWSTVKAQTNVVTSAWAISTNGAQESIVSFCVYNGKLYAGQGTGTGDGDIFVFDGTTWAISYDGSQEAIWCLCVYNGKLYAGQGSGTGDGDVLVFNGTSWAISYDGPQEYIYALCVYNGKLYAGQCGNSGDADVLVYDGSSWSTAYDGAQEEITALCVYNGKLYAGQGNGAGDGDVLVFDETSWAISYDGGQEYVLSLCVYDGRLYAGLGTDTGDGDILVYDGNAWGVSYNGAQEKINALCTYNGRLYAGQGNGVGDGDVLVFDGTSWTISYNGAREYIWSIGAYNEKLYAGQAVTTGDGDIYTFATIQPITLNTSLSVAHTNPVVYSVSQFPLTNLSTNTVLRVDCDQAGGQVNTAVSVETEVLR